MVAALTASRRSAPLIKTIWSSLCLSSGRSHKGTGWTGESAKVEWGRCSRQQT